MKNVKNVTGNIEASKELVIAPDMIYVHNNIRKVDGEDDLYVYDEIQYTPIEYIGILSQENLQLKEELTNTQLALVDLYENKES